MRVSACLLLAVASGAGCELLTHAFDFRVGTAPASLLCAACPDGGDLFRPPCPVADPSADLGRTFVYAARRSYLGSAAVGLGLDLDCSDKALPVLCAPRSTTGWQAQPHGIDDALLERVLGPVSAGLPASRAVDLDAAISEVFERGHYGVVVSVDRWNGRPDDPSVEVTVRTSPGLAAGAAPAWAGGDTWERYPDVDADGVRPFALDHAEGYVAGGTLVVDARATGASLFRFGPAGARFELLITGLAFTGALTPARLGRFTMTGVIDQPSASTASLALAMALGACAGGAAGAFLGALPPQIAVAADMPFIPSASQSSFCDGISFAWALDAEPARLADPAADGGQGAAGAACP